MINAVYFQRVKCAGFLWLVLGDRERTVCRDRSIRRLVTFSLILKKWSTFHWGLELSWWKGNIKVDNVWLLISSLSHSCFLFFSRWYEEQQSLFSLSACKDFSLFSLCPHRINLFTDRLSLCFHIPAFLWFLMRDADITWWKSCWLLFSPSLLFLWFVLPERQLANSMTSSSSLPPSVSGISKELAELRHLVQFPEEIACILTEQEQQLYQRVGGKKICTLNFSMGNNR